MLPDAVLRSRAGRIQRGAVPPLPLPLGRRWGRCQKHLHERDAGLFDGVDRTAERFSPAASQELTIPRSSAGRGTFSTMVMGFGAAAGGVAAGGATAAAGAALGAGAAWGASGAMPTTGTYNQHRN